MPGVMCISDAGARTVNGYVAISVDATVCPPGRMNTLLDGMPVRGHGSSFVPTVDDAPLSATADGIDPFSTPYATPHLVVVVVDHVYRVLSWYFVPLVPP